MALIDYLWLVRLIIEILKIIAAMTEDERIAMACLRETSEQFSPLPQTPKRTKVT